MKSIQILSQIQNSKTFYFIDFEVLEPTYDRSIHCSLCIVIFLFCFFLFLL